MITGASRLQCIVALYGDVMNILLPLYGDMINILLPAACPSTPSWVPLGLLHYFIQYNILFRYTIHNQI